MIQVHPEDGLVDDRLMIHVKGLQAEQLAIIRAEMKDSKGMHWQSFAGFYADENGCDYTITLNHSASSGTNFRQAK